MRFFMKKNSIRLFLISILFIFSFSSCDLTVTDGNYRNAPNVEYNGAGNINISIPKISSETKYITIYRFNASNETPSNTELGIPIGIIYPQKYSEDAYTFTDSYANNARSYCYKLRYYTSDDNIIFTKWSDKIAITNGTSTYGLDYDLTYNSVELTYDTTTETLTLDSALEFSSSVDDTIKEKFETTPYIAIECSEGSRLMPFSTDTSVSIRNFIPSEFYDTEITILGFVAIQNAQTKKDKEDDDETLILQQVFTEPSEVSGDTTFIISSSSNVDGIIYK